MTSETLFPTDDTDELVSVYMRQGRTLDDLPYTDDFEAIYAAMYAADEGEAHAVDPAPVVSRAQLFHRLHNLRKAGKLPRLGRSSAQSSAPRLETEAQKILTALVEQQVESLSKRDQLLYDPRFDEVVHAFNRKTDMNLSPHDAWRVIAKLAKRSK